MTTNKRLVACKVAGLLGKSQRDGDGDLLDVDRLFTILKPHRKVKAVFYGHSHRYAVDRRDHVQLINLPAVGYNFRDDQPVGWVDARFSREGVAMTLRAIGGNRESDGQTTTVEWM